MFARVIEARIQPDKQQEFRTQVLPNVENTLRKQPGLLEIVALTSETDTTQVLSITFWRNQTDAQNYEKNVAPGVVEKVRPYLQAEVAVRHYNVETNTAKKIAAAA